MPTSLEQLHQDWHRAWLERDERALDSLMAPEFVYVAPNGRVLDRAAMLAVVGSPDFRIDHGSRTELRIVVLGPDAAVLVDRWQGAGTHEGRPFRDDLRCSFVCVRKGGHWRVAWEHCSTLAR